MKVTVLSRDDVKQSELSSEFSDSRLHCVIDDVASPIRLRHCCDNADIVIHAAAMKTVHGCEAAPERATLINVSGTANVVAAASTAGVPLVIGFSSDKAVQPVNVYGSTKLLTERLFEGGAEHWPGTRLLIVRLCNVAGSRGGVIARMFAAGEQHNIRLTHPDMTRFFVSDADVSRLVAECAAFGVSGEIYVPRVRSARIADLIEVMTGAPAVTAGDGRHGERLFEWLVGPDEYLLRSELTHFVVSSRPRGQACPAGWEPHFRSDSPMNLMAAEEIRAFLARHGLLAQSACRATAAKM
jgi:UDP-N-acetylglucosamine 4,6-dehydratase